MPANRAGIRLRNALHVADEDALRVRGRLGRDPAGRQAFGEPVFEEGAIVVFAVRPG